MGKWCQWEYGPPIIIDGLESDGCSIVHAKLRSNDNENNRSPSSNDANTAGNAALEGFAGVALFGQPSVEADLAAFEWAYKHLRVSEKYRLRIIHVNVQNENPPGKRPGSQYEYPSLKQNLLKNYPGWENKIVDFISNLETHNVLEHICGVTYDEVNFEAALQCAIKEEVDLDTIVLPWWVAHDANGNGPPVKINGLGSGGCSIVLAKQVDRTLSSTEVSAAQQSANDNENPPPSSEEANSPNDAPSSDDPDAANPPTLEIIIAGTTQSANEPLSRNQNT